jgi:membrane-bound metal-dependent hydrolase YbcI (DUF457 family)
MAPAHLAAGWLAGCAVAGALGLPLQVALPGAALSAGVALLPDVDTPSSVAGRTPGLRWMSAATEAAAGHRGVTHSLLATVLIGLVAWWWPGALALAVVAGVLLWRGLWSVAHRYPGDDAPRWEHGAAAKRADTIRAAIVFPALIGWVVFLAPAGDLHLLVTAAPWLAAAGYLSHLMLDACTYDGIPAAWPIQTRMRLPYGWRTRCGSRLERRIITPLLTVAAGTATVLPAL